MIFTADVVINIIIVLGTALGVFFALKSKVDKIEAVNKKNTKIIETLESEKDTEAKRVEKDLIASIESHYALLKGDMDKFTTRSENEHSKIYKDIKDLTANIFDTMEKNKDILNTKIVKSKDLSTEYTNKAFDKLDNVKDKVTLIEKTQGKLENEINSVVGYELVHIKQDIKRIDNTLVDFISEFRGFERDMNKKEIELLKSIEMSKVGKNK